MPAFKDQLTAEADRGRVDVRHTEDHEEQQVAGGVRIRFLVVPLLLTAGMIFRAGERRRHDLSVAGRDRQGHTHATRRELLGQTCHTGQLRQFRVRKTTAKRRTFSLASRLIVVPARRDRFLVIYFDARGRYTYVSRTPQKAIRGTFRID